MFRERNLNPGVKTKNEILTAFATTDYWFLVPLLNIPFPIYLAIIHNINQFDRPHRFVDYVKREFRLAKKVKDGPIELVFLDHDSSLFIYWTYSGFFTTGLEICNLQFSDGQDESLFEWFIPITGAFGFSKQTPLGPVENLLPQEFFDEFHKRHQKRCP